MSPRMERTRWLAPAFLVPVLLCLLLAAQAQASPRVYWSTFGGTTIGSADPDGGEVDSSLISEASNPVGVAVDAVHIYWANPFVDMIGRANLDGSGVEKEFITGVNPYGLAVAEGHVYWTDADAHTIGRANLDGSGVEDGLIGNVGSFFGLAADSEHLYWGNEAGESIGRANLDGSGANTSFVPGVEGAFGLATTVAAATLSTAAPADTHLGAGAIHGTAVLRGANAPTGTIALRLYGPDDETCARSPLQTSSVAVSGNGSYPSAAFAPIAVGAYRWQASYSGDAENEPVDGACGEPMRVTDPPPASASGCSLVVASAGTFTPATRPGKLTPGVRAKITVGTPSQLSVDASLTYRLKRTRPCGPPRTTRRRRRSLRPP